MNYTVQEVVQVRRAIFKKMKLRNNILYLFVRGLIVLLIPVFLFANNSEQIEKLLQKTTFSYSKIKTISANIKQEVNYNGNKGVYEGIYFADSGCAYVEFTKPYLQKIWVVNDTVYWYIPSKNTLYKREYGVGNSIDAKGMYAKLFAQLDSLLKVNIKEVGTIKKKYLISGILRGNTAFQTIVDKKTELVSEYIMYDGNAKEMFHIYWGNYENIDGIYMAKFVESKWYVSGYIDVKTYYDNIILNTEINDSLFLPVFSDSIIIKELKLW